MIVADNILPYPADFFGKPNVWALSLYLPLQSSKMYETMQLYIYANINEFLSKKSIIQLLLVIKDSQMYVRCIMYITSNTAKNHIPKILYPRHEKIALCRIFMINNITFV